MKNKDLLNAMNHIEDRFVQDAASGKKDRKAKGRRLAAIGIAAACICLAAGAGIWAGLSDRGQQGKEDSVYANYAIAQAEYPECAPYPAQEWQSTTEKKEDYIEMLKKWQEDRERIAASSPIQESLYSFYAATMKEMLAGAENNNRAYSPLNLYMALSMLAEVTDGNSRLQLLELLNAEDVGNLRENVPVLWRANYSDDGMVTSVLANSLWLNQDFSFVPATMGRLADTYYASSFQGEMGSEEFTQALRAWLNAQTGGLLTEQADKQKLDADTVLALVSTIYYRAQWEDPFFESETAAGIFHAASGDISCDFMHQKKVRDYYSGESFSAVRLTLQESGSMWLFLPEEGVGVNQLTDGEEVLDIIYGKGGLENQRNAVVSLELPKFDILSDIDLMPKLKAMGITDVFDDCVADFRPALGEGAGISVQEAKHAARVAVDETGLTAAAYTMVVAEETGYLAEEGIDFILDRPFLFAVTGADGALLFAGVVEQPKN